MQDASRSEAGPFLPDSERLPHVLVTTRHRQRLGDWICIGLTSAGYSVSYPYLSSPSHRSMEMPLDPGRAGLDRARFCAPTTSLDAAPGHCVSARVSQLAGAKAGRTLGVPAVERRLRWGHQRSVTHDYVCPLRGCGPRGCLSGFEARTFDPCSIWHERTVRKCDNPQRACKHAAGLYGLSMRVVRS